MEPYILANLPADFGRWLAARFLKPILNVEGGWEYWIQIDFPSWLDAMTGRTFDFRREYTEGDVRLDWIVNATLGTNVTAINIKAQTHKYQTTRLLADVDKDVAKLRQLVGNTVARKMIVAVVDKSAYDALAGNGYVQIYRAPDDSFAILWRNVAPGG